MSDHFQLESTPGHVGVDFNDSVETTLHELKQAAEAVGTAKSAAFAPEVDYLRGIVTALRADLPPAIKAAGWPAAMASGDKLDEFIVMLLKDPARAARGRGTNASAKLALCELDAR